MPRKPKKSNSRLIVLSAFLIVCMLALSVQQFRLQVVNRKAELESAYYVSANEMIVKAARGEILDCYGRPFAVNQDSYDIMLSGAFLPPESTNDVLTRLTNLMTKLNEKWIDNLPLSADAPYSFIDGADTKKLITNLNLNHYATAQNCVDAMIKAYKLQGIDSKLQRRLMGIRYSMAAENFSATQPFTFAENIQPGTMADIETLSNTLPGVQIIVAPIRKYLYPSIAAKLIGTVGKIPAAEVATYKKNGYPLDATVGTSGLEQAYEQYLAGKNGIDLVKQNKDGTVVGVQTLEKPQAGNTVQLTIDIRLQKAAEDSVKKRIDSVPGSSIAAVVVSNVKTNAILASADYPNYSLDQIKNDYNSLLTDPKKPLINYAISSAYPPGSIFKPGVAIAALQTGAITAGTSFDCKHTQFFEGLGIKKCWGEHGWENVVGAIKDSCDIFFYNTAVRTTIPTINSYCRQFGLGVGDLNSAKDKLGHSESSSLGEYYGTLTSPNNTKMAPLVGIGQADTTLSPLQLATYTSTIANGGTRYQAHFLESVSSYNLQNQIQPEQIKVLNKIVISNANLKLVKTGMLGVTEHGTAKSVFGDFKIKVGGKTGTAQVTGKKDNRTFIGFAPYDNPQIAVSVVAVGADKVHLASLIAKDVLEAYFSPPTVKYTPQSVDTLLS